MLFSYQMEQKTLIKAICTNNIQTGEKVFYNYYTRFVFCYFSDRVKKLVYTLVCMCPIYIYREEKKNKYYLQEVNLVFRMQIFSLTWQCISLF